MTATDTTAVQDASEAAPLTELSADAIDTVFSVFDDRPAQLRWQQDDDGVVYVTPARTVGSAAPETLVQVELGGDGPATVIVYEDDEVDAALLTDLDSIDSRAGQATQSGMMD